MNITYVPPDVRKKTGWIYPALYGKCASCHGYYVATIDIRATDAHQTPVYRCSGCNYARAVEKLNKGWRVATPEQLSDDYLSWLNKGPDNKEG